MRGEGRWGREVRERERIGDEKEGERIEYERDG